MTTAATPKLVGWRKPWLKGTVWIIYTADQKTQMGQVVDLAYTVKNTGFMAYTRYGAKIAGPFLSVDAAQAAVEEWYNHRITHVHP